MLTTSDTHNDRCSTLASRRPHRSCVSPRLALLLVRQTPFFAIDVMRTLVRRLRAMNELLAR